MSVVVEAYNSEWPLQFQKIKGSLEIFLDGVEYVSIEHVGSTSVPGLAAKPIIDIDIIVGREKVDDVATALVERGNFTYLGELGIVDRHAVRDPIQDPRRNIYVCVEGAFQTRNHLGLRNTLLSNQQLRDEYAQVKYQLAAQGLDIQDYIEGKTAIIQKILKEAGLLSEEELAAIDKANESGRIRTNRLMLREFFGRDVADFHALESIPEVVRYQNYGPMTEEEAKKYVLDIMKGMSATPRTHFELAVLYENHFIGRVGAKIKYKDQKGTALSLPHADLWFSFMPELHGKGFATEAMRAFILVLPRPVELEIECDPRNTGSWKLAERLGFEKLSLTERIYESKGEWVDSLVYRKTMEANND
ncbi:GrpB protein-domain-containing protein [Clohesyomyces aquaticus]|uniref:GrpB protein-domain-containing protein n=1 Tax=Clohesyomyces aquaticus TaxID=1231657 RepID=A0A1Y1ZVF9_9PLEO|nr:GrpB protein-domain-containing protein [Clohesyomyces aquaticus]